MKSKNLSSSIKFRNFCFNNELKAEIIAEALNVSVATIYKYWSGSVAVPDTNKKILEKKFGLDIYDTFFKEL